MAHTKSQGSTTNGRDSAGQRRGVKVYNDQAIHAGSIIVRQCGTKVHPGRNVGMGSDNTLFAKISGIVKYTHKSGNRCFVSVMPLQSKA
ncbi:MAG: 50S ribosomal protein L27 [Endomicrobiales bacterium]|nr:50S ribosomal protein L27 [Endomicrobiales bacterium]